MEAGAAHAIHAALLRHREHGQIGDLVDAYRCAAALVAAWPADRPPPRQEREAVAAVGALGWAALRAASGGGPKPGRLLCLLGAAGDPLRAALHAAALPVLDSEDSVLIIDPEELPPGLPPPELLVGGPRPGPARALLCADGACSLPLRSPEALIRALARLPTGPSLG